MSAGGALRAQARHLLADAFAADPWARYVLGGAPGTRSRALAEVMRVPVWVAAERGGLVAERDAADGTVVAVSTWVPADRRDPGLAGLLGAGALALPLVIGPAAMARLVRDEGGLDAILDDAVRPGDAYLWVLGVARARHGQGLGRRVVERTCAEAAARGHRRLVLNTENPGNVALYRRMGFELVDRRTRPSGLLTHVLARPLDMVTSA